MKELRVRVADTVLDWLESVRLEEGYSDRAETVRAILAEARRDWISKNRGEILGRRET